MMAGKLCYGQSNAEVPHNPILSTAYCEGRAAAVAGELVTANPHTAGTPEYIAWDNGWDSYNGGVGSPLARDCCADLAYDGV